MAVRKTHVKSDKRIKREKERKEAAASGAKRQHSKKHKLGSKKKTAVDTRFKVTTAGYLPLDHVHSLISTLFHSSKVRQSGTKISLSTWLA